MPDPTPHPPQPLSAEQVAAVKEAALEFLPKQSGQLLDLRTVARVCDTAESLRAALSAATRELEHIKHERDEYVHGRWDDARAAFGTLERYGFRRCDIPACNCGSYHAPDGFLRPEGAERLREARRAAERERDELAALLDEPLRMIGSDMVSRREWSEKRTALLTAWRARKSADASTT